MSFQSAPESGSGSRTWQPVSSAESLAFKPNPRFFFDGLKRIREIDLSKPAHFHLFDYTVDYDCIGLEQAGSVVKQVETLLKKDQWLELAKQIQNWDKTCRKTELGKPFTELALSTIRRALAAAVFPPDVSNFDFYCQISDATMARVEAARESARDDYVLSAILAQLYIDRGWFARGGGLAEDITLDGWNEMTVAFDKADQLVGALYPKGFNSALLAQVQFGLVVGIDGGREVIKSRYQAWADLDPSNQLPHRSYAFHLMPFWFGSFELLEKEARAAASRSRGMTGAAAYTSFYLEAIQHEEEALSLMDPKLFAKGVTDLIEHRNNLYFTNAFAYALSRAFVKREGVGFQYGSGRRANNRRTETRALYEEILKTQLTAITPKAWGGSLSNALRYVSTLFQADLKRGARLVLDEAGLRVAAPQN